MLPSSLHVKTQSLWRQSDSRHPGLVLNPMCRLALLPGVAPAGEKLSESRAADVRELCNTLLSAYLIQLLDTGLLHADPHPGNLIRTGALDMQQQQQQQHV